MNYTAMIMNMLHWKSIFA